MTINEASKKLNVSPQLLRSWAQSKDGCPFISIIRSKEKVNGRNTYYVSEERMNLWKEGKI